jgi:hypothetical protein
MTEPVELLRDRRGIYGIGVSDPLRDDEQHRTQVRRHRAQHRRDWK